MAKRLRSLASILWETDIETDGLEATLISGEGECNKIKQLQTENAKLREQLLQVEMEISSLKTPKPLPTLPGASHRPRSDLLQAWPSQTWVSCLREDVSQLPRLWQEILPALHETQNARGMVLFDLPKSPNASASTVLSHAEGCVRSLFKKHPAVFKVGITSNPIKRWNHSRYGYAFDKIEGWLGMKILAVCETSFCAGMLESALIRIFKDTPGCRNDRPGGETPSVENGPHFTYVVYRILLPPRRVVSSAVNVN